MTASPVPNTFTAGTPAVSAQVNANFAAVINDLNSIDAGQVTTGTLAAGRVSATLITSGTLPAARLPTRATANQGPAGPSGTSSTSLVMMGLGKDQAGGGAHSLTITPATSGTVFFMVTGNAANATPGANMPVALYIGTGTAPSNGVAATGTIISATQTLFTNDSGFAIQGS